MDQLLIGENIHVSMNSYETKLNNNLVVVGPPGCGKTSGVNLPNLQSITHTSAVVADVKGDIYAKTKKHFEELDYKINCFNTIDIHLSSHYNPLDYVETEEDILRLANQLYGEKTAKDPFWDDTACMLLVAIIAYVVSFAPKYKRNLSYVSELISKCKAIDTSRGIETSLYDLFDRIPSNSIAKKYYDQVSTAALNTLRSIIITLNAKMYKFSSEEVRKLTSSNDIDFSTYKDQKTITYVLLDDSDDTFYTLASVFFSQMIHYFVRESKNLENYRYSIPIQFFLDDFCAYKLPRFEHLIACLRSRNIGIIVFLQSDSQLIQNYGESAANTILNCCDTYIYMGGSDLLTCKSISQKVNKPLDEILYMPLDKEIIIRRGQKPKMVKIFNYFNSPYYEQEIENKKKIETKKNDSFHFLDYFD